MASLIERFQSRMAALREGAAAGAGQAWDDLGSYDEADVDRFLASSVPIVVASQAQAAVLTDAYLAAETGRAPLGIDPATVTAGAVRAGATPDEVYHRSFVEVWSKLKAGTPWVDAVAAGRARVASTAKTDVQLAMRGAANQVIERDPRIVGYRRVLTGRSCALCATASTQRYHRGDLLPIHGNCDCSIAPIWGNRDPGRMVNQALVRDLKEAGGPQYWKDRGITVEGDQVLVDGAPLRSAVEEHGELGPVLVNAAHEFTQL